MGDLPSSRIEVPERAFFCVSLDFAGPLTFKNGTECVKGYVAVSICFASKAVLLEAVSSLTSDAMAAALRRFLARRGIPSQIVSDNATNFVSARRDLNELGKVARAGAQSYSSIEWLFIPPRSPNFGGLWEAAVKSMKHHLRRVMGYSILNYEEMTTILCQIEQELNNRPLMALTNNPDNIFAIAPSMAADWMLSHNPVCRRWMPEGIQQNDFAVLNSYSLNFGRDGLLSMLHHSNFEASGDKNVLISQLMT